MILKDILKCKSHLQKVYLLIIILHQFINILTYLQNRYQKYQNGKVSFNSSQQKIERKCLPSPSGKRSQHLPNPPVVRQNKPYLPTWKGEMTPWKLLRIFIFRSKFANWESCQASALERLAKNSSLLKAVNYFRKKFHHRCFAESASLILAVSICLRFGVSFTDQKKWNFNQKECCLFGILITQKLWETCVIYLLSISKFVTSERLRVTLQIAATKLWTIIWKEDLYLSEEV